MRRLKLHAYFDHPGDGRRQPRIPAPALLWGLVSGHLLRESTFHAVEALVRSSARVCLGVSRTFGDDALAYFTERLDPGPTRAALARVLRQTKRNKAFATCRFIGLAIDGTTTARCAEVKATCTLCRPLKNAAHEIMGYRHHLVLVSVVGTGLPLPFDVEPYGPGDSEYAAGGRLLRRAVGQVGRRFADYVVVDAEFAKAPFLHAANELGLRVVVRLKDNHPELLEAVQRQYAGQLPTATFEEGSDRIEVWDGDHFDPWETLRWETVRVVCYRQHKPTGAVIEAFWLTDFPRHEVTSRELYRMAKSRWEIENAGFNDAKTRYGLEHMCHHHTNSLVVGWLLTSLALTIERLYRLRYLHRGTHAVRPAIELLRQWRLSLGRSLRGHLSRPPTVDTS